MYKSMTLAVISNREANYLLQTGLEIFPPCDKYTASPLLSVLNPNGIRAHRLKKV